MKLSSKALACGQSPMRKFHPYAVAAAAAGKKIYHLNIGQPDIHTPDALYDAIHNFRTPVLAYGRGGACESVRPGKTGYWFKEQTVESLADCIERFERDGVAYSKEEIREHSRSFSEERFERELKEYCERRMADWQQELLDCSHWEKEELD